jgi:flagellar biosynthesis protein FlhB
MSAEQERTQEATPRYRAKVRASGQAPRSQLATPAFAILFFAPVMYALNQNGKLFLHAFYLATACATRGSGLDAGLLLACAHDIAQTPSVATLSVVMLGPIGVALASSIASGSLGFAPLAVVPQLARLRFSMGIKRVANFESIFHASCSVVLIITLLCATIAPAADGLAATAHAQDLPGEVIALARVLVTTWQRTAGLLIAFALIDVCWGRARFAASLRMTPRQLREDRAQTEARPETKQRRKTVGMRRSRSLRIEAIRKATAVVTNPTHVAVALRYAPPAVDVPVVVARGADLSASIVREAALRFDIPLIVSADLARTLYAKVDVDEPIPEDCYAAVAAIFAWIVRTRGVLRGCEDATWGS